ncbi:MAG: DegV family protein [Ruminococcaceae bacterium]|nr:DegV family protein [Oscillospiraceae bacterium]
MSDFVIFTDSGCDIAPEILSSWGVYHRDLNFRFEGDEKEYSNADMNSNEFYAKMREGGVAKTSAVNVETFASAFEELLAEGKDILYIGFSSGLSTTFNSARIAAQQVAEKYPERKIITIDTLAASAGQGLILKLALDKKNAGATIEEVAEYTENIKLKISIWFTVDDLVYLKRGGRVSPTAAFFGNMLGIKPILHMDNEGHLIPLSKVRGRKTSIMALADKYGELSTELGGANIFISHGDCIADAEYLAELLKTRYGATVDLITNVGTVIGAHSGPGTLAFFFVGKHR